MSPLDKIRRRTDSNHHVDIERRLDDQERRVKRFERRLKRVEIELGIVRPDVVDEIEGTA